MSQWHQPWRTDYIEIVFQSPSTWLKVIRGEPIIAEWHLIVFSVFHACTQKYTHFEVRSADVIDQSCWTCAKQTGATAWYIVGTCYHPHRLVPTWATVISPLHGRLNSTGPGALIDSNFLPFKPRRGQRKRNCLHILRRPIRLHSFVWI